MPGEVRHSLKRIVSSHRPTFTELMEWASGRRDPKKVNVKEALREFIESNKEVKQSKRTKR
jgi:hypothetical protein